jgi:hypothetical protein
VADFSNRRIGRRRGVSIRYRPPGVEALFQPGIDHRDRRGRGDLFLRTPDPQKTGFFWPAIESGTGQNMAPGSPRFAGNQEK